MNSPLGRIPRPFDPTSDSPMKIAIVQDSLIRGGAERQALYATRELTRRGCDVEMIHYNRAPYEYNAKAQFGVEPIHVPKNRTYLRFIRRLGKYLRERRFDVVHGFMDNPTIYAGLAGRLARVPAILGGVRVEYHSAGLARLAHRIINRFAAGWIVNSRAAARALEHKIGAAPERVFVVYNGIDESAFKASLSPAAAKEALGLRPDAGVVAIVARLEPQKNHRLFLEAAAIAARRRPSARFLVVGDGPLRREMEALASSLGVAGGVHFLGNRSDIPDILAATDISVLSSHYEGLANVLLEAMCVGVPVLSTAYPGVDELVTDGQEGFVVPLGDAEALAGRMCDLLESQPLRRRLGDRGKATVGTRFSLEAMGTRLLSVYQECYDRSRAARG